MLEVTNRCNLACPMCLRDKAEFATRDMSLRFVDDLLERNPPPRAIWPYGYGEPLLYPQLLDLIGKATRRGLVVSLSTNATRLRGELGRELLESGLDYLVIAFDGASASTYETYRKGARFEAVRENVERFIDLKRRSGSTMHLTVQMILMDGTRNEVSDFRNDWSRPGVDAVRVRQDLAPQRSPDRRKRSRPCFFLWRGPLFVQAAGTVIPCPYFHGSVPVGDLNSQNVDEVWNSRPMQELRRAHLEGDVSAYAPCSRCPRHQPHKILVVSSFFVTTRIMRRLLPWVERLQQKLGRTFFE